MDSQCYVGVIMVLGFHLADKMIQVLTRPHRMRFPRSYLQLEQLRAAVRYKHTNVALIRFGTSLEGEYLFPECQSSDIRFHSQQSCQSSFEGCAAAAQTATDLIYDIHFPHFINSKCLRKSQLLVGT